MADHSVFSTRQRSELRRKLLLAREQFASDPRAPRAAEALAANLLRVLGEIDPQLLGVYWAIGSEFDAIAALEASALHKLPLALPYARRVPREMHYCAWDGKPPTLTDECGLPAASGPQVQPDLVLVPCVGFTRSGWRIGFGGGYFDRWLAANPHVTTVGVAWAVSEVSDEEFERQGHDQGLMLVVTEQGVVG